MYATDAILSQLMAAPRSIYAWDIVIQKMNNLLFFDKREDNTQFDLLTVSETATEVILLEYYYSYNGIRLFIFLLYIL